MLPPHQQAMLVRGPKDREHPMAMPTFTKSSFSFFMCRRFLTEDSRLKTSQGALYASNSAAIRLDHAVNSVGGMRSWGKGSGDCLRTTALGRKRLTQSTRRPE